MAERQPTRASKHCSIEGCERLSPKLWRTMCYYHYRKWWDVNRGGIPRPSARERFWGKVGRRGASQCWIWTGALSDSGYGIIFWQGRSRPATHVALQIAGKERPIGTQACHRCDNPPCVNPNHLYWGTPRDNVDDCVARGRRPKGVETAQATLTDQQVLDIRHRYAGGETGPCLAREFQVSKTQIYRIASGKKWAHLGGPLTAKKNTQERV